MKRILVLDSDWIRRGHYDAMDPELECECYSDTGNVFRRVIKNNYSVLMVDTRSLEAEIAMDTLIRANYDLGKYTVLIYHSFVERLIFALFSFNMLDRLVFVRYSDDMRGLARTLKEVAVKPHVPLNSVFAKLI